MMRWRSGLAVAAVGALGLTLLTGVPAPSEAQAAAAPKKVVAIGDSVMAGFGYYPTANTGAINNSIPEMPFWDLDDCLPAHTIGFVLNGACSANVLTQETSMALAPGIDWAPDYGYWNQVAWSSQFAREINAGFSDDSIAGAYRNFALSGSTAAQWADDLLVFKRLGSTTSDTGLGAVIAEDPDVITITVGANPTLAKMLLGQWNRCFLVNDKYACFRELIEEARTPEGLREIYSTLLDNTKPTATIIVMLYPNIIPGATPFTAEQFLVAVDALNTTITDAVNDVRNDNPAWANRIGTVSRYFNTGLPPGSYTAWAPCYGLAALGQGVDGPSNQSSFTQEVFAVTRKFSGWCKGDPWIISGDTGIHPNIRGYQAMSGPTVATYKAMVGDVPRAVPVLHFADPPQLAQVGESYGPYQFLASGSPLPIFTLADDTSALPPGMQLTARGSLGGIPTTAGTYSFRVRVSNGIDDTTPVSGTLSIEVRAAPAFVPPPPPLPVTPPPPLPEPPPPPLPEPSSAPLGVMALAGDGSALVTWSAPARAGTGAIKSYEATASPGGATCSTTGALTCEITGLTNGTRYSFTVRARNGAGLSPASEASRAVTPRASALLISGSRGTGARVQKSKVTITGLVTGLEADAVTITFTSSGSSGRMLSRRDVPVNFDGRFTMTRRLNSGARVVASVAGVTSNVVVIPALGTPRR